MKFFATLVVVLGLGGASFAADQGHQRHITTGEKLGDVSFPTSCAPAVQKSFERGVALLHSFAYPEAEHEFQHVAAADPKCAIAYWGEAMSQYYQLWIRPHNDTLKRGAELLQKAKAIGAKTARERDYIDALSAFYSDTDIATHDKRAAAYTSEMAKVHERYPTDDEASAFYALALIASAPPDDKSLTNFRKAADILNQIIPRHPNHPGALHYLIHACDNPQLAPMALDAARRYGNVASASAHAVHMPSHIFARLGYWQDDINANLASVQASKRPGAQMADESALHAEDFLTYAYLQIGENDKAQQIIADAQTHMGHSSAGMEAYHEEMRTHLPLLYALETRQWANALALQPPAGIASNAEAITYWAHAIAAGHLRDVAAARKAVEQYKAALEATRKGKRPYAAAGMQHDLNEAVAWQAFAENKIDDAVRQMREVADEQDAMGKGEVELPAREMLADMLLEAKRYDDALSEYKTSMKVDPNRFNGLYGAARAASLAGHSAVAKEYYSKLIANCGSSNQRAELAQARAALGHTTSAGGGK